MQAQKILQVVKRYWGFDTLRPLQSEAIDAALAGRDSLVVMPTGGGKSLCYQVPPALDGATDVVVSPLISLMKDQVDGLTTSGYPAACLHSGLTPAELRKTEADAAEGKFRLLFVAPERLFSGWFLPLVERLNVRRFAIDEAHCISHWGHDFRPEYRQMAQLRQRFPQASLHAFTATATPRVRDDIAVQLALRDPAVLVGRFDRPNLVYRIWPQTDRYKQTLDVIARHSQEAVIVYCITRKDTEAMAGWLAEHHIKAAAYHAGLTPAERHRTQEAFAEERLDVVVATVAFGMGIDRSNVRCVLHASMPKSIEHYQQETGRAGRDGLEAECVLLYTAADGWKWEGMMKKSAEESPEAQALVAAQLRLIRQMQGFCGSAQCRHRALTEYFGQAYEEPNCGACDVCLGEVEGLEDATVLAQKILSCIYRCGQRFGAGYIADVLLGAKTEAILRRGHHELSTYGLLKDMNKKQLQGFVYQLVDQGLVDRVEIDDEITVLKLNERSWEVLHGQREVRLVRPKEKTPAKTAQAEVSWEGVDRGLFDRLREWRREAALARQVPAYVVLNDNALRELARVRPTRRDVLERVGGIGQKKLADFGEALLAIISEYCASRELSTNQAPSVAAPSVSRPSKPRGEAREAAFRMFGEGRTIEEVMSYTVRAHSTVVAYLLEFVAERRPPQIDIWIDPAVYDRVVAAAVGAESPRLKPLHEHLGGAVSYDDIRLVLAHRAAMSE